MLRRIREALNYWLDLTVSRGTQSIVVALIAFVLVLTGVGTVIRQLLTSEGVLESAWRAFSRIIDLSSIQQDQGWPRAESLAFALIGLLCASLVIALVVNALQNSIDRVRNGSPRIRSVPDLVILGWSDSLFVLIREFAHAAPNRSVAIISDNQREWMDAQIARELGDLRHRVTVQCRTGNRSDPRDLDLVRIDGVKRVVIFGEPGDRDDSAVVKSVFSTLTAANEVPDRLVIAEVCAREVALSLEHVFGSQVTTVNSNDVLAFMLAQAVRDKGMGQLIDQLTSYRGGEFYEVPLPLRYIGKTFGEVTWRLSNTSPIGYSRAGVAQVLPHPECVMEANDVLVVVDRTKPTAVFDDGVDVPRDEWTRAFGERWTTQHLAIVGWNRIASRATQHLRGFLNPDSTITVICDRHSMSPGEIETLDQSTAVTKIVWTDSSPELMDALHQHLTAESFDAVALVPYRDELTAEQSDTQTLVSLASASRAIAGSRTRVVGELRESRSEILTELLRPDDLLLSDALTASLIAQMVDRPWLESVLADLLDFRGSALFIHPPQTVLNDIGSSDFSYLQIRHHLLSRGVLVIGVRVGLDVELNPKADQQFTIDGLTAVIVVGQGLGWNTSSAQSRLSGLDT